MMKEYTKKVEFDYMIDASTDELVSYTRIVSLIVIDFSNN